MIASSFLLFSDDACVKVNRQCRARTIVKRRALSSDSYTHTYLELMSNSNHIVNLGIPWKKKKEKQETADSGKSESSWTRKKEDDEFHKFVACCNINIFEWDLFFGREKMCVKDFLWYSWQKKYIDGIITFAGPTDGGVAFTISRGALMVSYYGTPCQDLYSDWNNLDIHSQLQALSHKCPLWKITHPLSCLIDETNQE